MADRMRNDDLDMDMGGAGQQKDDFGKQTPGRNKQDDFSTGQRGAGQPGGQQREPGNMKDDDDFDNFGNSEKSGGKSGQNW